MNMTGLILAALSKHEALTAREIARITGVPLVTVQGVIARERSRGKPFRVVEWTHEQTAIRRNLVGVYSIQPGRDANKPPLMSNAERCARWYRKTKRVASVFQMAA